MTAQRLLLIDDDARLAAMVGDYLRGAGFEVDVAPTLAAGRERLRRRQLRRAAARPDAARRRRPRPVTRELRAARAHAAAAAADADRARRADSTASSASNSAPTTTWASRSSRANCWPASRPCCAARSRRPRPTKCCASAGWRSTSARARRASTASPATSPATSSSCCRCWRRPPGACCRATRSWTRLRGHPMEAFDRSIDVHISRIRAAIEDDPKKPQRVLTVRGVGYLFAKRQDGERPARTEPPPPASPLDHEDALRCASTSRWCWRWRCSPVGAGWLFQRQVQSERGRFEAQASERIAAWGDLIQRSLPAADAPSAGSRPRRCASGRSGCACRWRSTMPPARASGPASRICARSELPGAPRGPAGAAGRRPHAVGHAGADAGDAPPAACRGPTAAAARWPFLPPGLHGVGAGGGAGCCCSWPWRRAPIRWCGA